MIFAENAMDLKKMALLAKELQWIQEYIENLETFVEGSQKLTETISANGLVYLTKESAERVWEAHKKHVDIHYIVEGEENVQLASNEKLTKEEYHPEEDYYLLQGDFEKEQKIFQGQMLILWPEEPHKTGVKSTTAQTIKKIVFKVKL